MTQPNEAVGGATDNDTVIAAEPTIEDRFAAFAEPEKEEEAEEAQPVETSTEGEPELEAIEVEADDIAPIQPPVSWPDEDKAAFADLPRALQERVTAREAEREKFVQSKSREAAQARLVAEREASERVQSVQQAQIAQLVSLLPEVPQEPSAHLLASDPVAYADQMDYVRQMRAYRAELENNIYGIAQAQQQETEKQQQASMQASIELLQSEFPEFLEADKAPELQKAIRSTGLALGYSEDQLKAVDGQDILAIRTAMQWKEKAERFDALMAKQMEKVRQAKKLPAVTRPGAAPAKGAIANQRYTADRQAMRQGDTDAALRVFNKFL